VRLWRLLVHLCCACGPDQGYDLWTRQEAQRREVLRAVVKAIGVRGAFDPVVKASGSAIYALVKPVNPKKPRSQEEVNALLTLLDRPINTPPPPPPPVEPLEGPKKLKGESDEEAEVEEKV
jgi:hypothetical protein